MGRRKWVYPAAHLLPVRCLLTMFLFVIILGSLMFDLIPRRISTRAESKDVKIDSSREHGWGLDFGFGFLGPGRGVETGGRDDG